MTRPDMAALPEMLDENPPITQLISASDLIRSPAGTGRAHGDGEGNSDGLGHGQAPGPRTWS